MASIIKNRSIVSDDWTIVRAAEDGTLPALDALPAGKIVVPLVLWQASREALSATRSATELGVWLAPDSEPADIASDFDKVALLAVDFPVFNDGRGYSIGRLLRERYGYKGELRAIGAVLRDQLRFMFRCGFDAYAVREDKDIHDALKAFDEFTVQYQGAFDNPLPLFRRRDAAASKAAV
ncbi:MULTISPECIES: DUF934 domain-containing protein [Paraburkholderia]|uniref:DUF934 domain-containing protein n=1 Tax=Paraburkholderia TaxID=1822464 RepID=UPI00225942A6|nr:MULTISPECIES: DUF934 domain-containing protein [Paraburkholderia]MCX4159887.1 DUF934 domain-containing protein [Paraburkholderia megapolitana]MDN7155387.1 DUF934 domain-containing protein [Paraburkholderia sp. CHISQ3]MDQ6492431.1 DUF934 domain-containing protein [Paraburkholderia megapolitana]